MKMYNAKTVPLLPLVVYYTYVRFRDSRNLFYDETFFCKNSYNQMYFGLVFYLVNIFFQVFVMGVMCLSHALENVTRYFLVDLLKIVETLHHPIALLHQEQLGIFSSSGSISHNSSFNTSTWTPNPNKGSSISVTCHTHCTY